MTIEIVSEPVKSITPNLSVSGGAPARTPRVVILGVEFNPVSLHEAVTTLESALQTREAKQVCLVNAYTLALAQKDTELKTIFNRSAFVLADGMSIVWGARWIRAKLPQRVAGPDLMTELCARSAQKGHRIYLLGSTEDNLKQLVKTLQTNHPGLQIVGMHSPSFCDKLTTPENEKILQQLHDTKPDILFVGMSAPKQEKWIDENLSRLPVPLSIGVGAAFDFLSGRIPRAPRFWQERGLEWFYRLCCEPRRLWKRYLLGNAVYLGLLARQRVRMIFQPFTLHP